VADALAAAGGRAAWLGPRDALAAALADTVHAGDLVLTLGAGDVTLVGPEVLELLAERGSAAVADGEGGAGADPDR
jgi:UDP-N-acetylmuramate--alanine ligase